MLFQEEQRGVQIGVVVLVWNTPPNRPKLAALLHDTVEKRLDVHENSPLFVIDLVNEILGYHCCVRAVQSSLQACWGLKRDLDGHLEQTNWKPWSNLTSDPEPVFIFNSFCLRESVLQFVHIVDSQMTVLQNHPTARDEGVVIFLSGNLLLTLTHGDLVCGKLFLFLCHLINGHGWVTSSREKVEHWFAAGRLLVDAEDCVTDGCSEPLVELCFNELSTSNVSAVFTHRTHYDHSEEGSYHSFHDDSLLVIRNGHGFRLVLIIPLPPCGLIPLDELDNLSEENCLICAEGMPRELQEVQPDFIRQPFEGVRLLRLYVQSRACLQKHSNITRSQLIADNHDLHCHHELEHHLVALKKTTVHVSVDLISQETDDTVNSF
mmetsp:Transcript_35857/g.65814  ORF Transcript_35857/g.65814 Transcript_35857/m.65814 type:complete len:377 (-) Transcript_35857:3990-5120(-)